MELRTQLTDHEQKILLELGKGNITDGLRVALGMVHGTKVLFKDWYKVSIEQSQTLRDAWLRDRARRNRKLQLAS